MGRLLELRDQGKPRGRLLRQHLLGLQGRLHALPPLHRVLPLLLLLPLAKQCCQGNPCPMHRLHLLPLLQRRLLHLK